MKKISLVIIFLCIFFTQKVFAQNINSFQFYPPKDNQTKYGIKVAKNYYELKSPIKDNYIVVCYTVKNISANNINIEIKNSGYSFETAFNSTIKKQKRKHSKSAFIYPLEDARENFTTAWSAGNGLVFIFGLGQSFYDTFFWFPYSIGQSVINTVAVPYYSIIETKNKELYEKDEQDIKKLLNINEHRFFTLPPNHQAKIYGLFNIENPYLKLHLSYPYKSDSYTLSF